MHFEFGKPISEKLSKALRSHISKNDIADIALISNVGTSTLRDVVYRRNSVTENNYKAVIDLTERALQNCHETRQKFLSNEKFLSKITK